MVLSMVPTFAESPTGRTVARTLSDAAIRGIREGETRTDGSLNCHGYGSSVMVTAAFGMVAAAQGLEALWAAAAAPKAGQKADIL